MFSVIDRYLYQFYIKKLFRYGNDYAKIVSFNGLFLMFITNQTPEICLNAVRNTGFALEFVKEQTEEICMEAIKQNSYAFPYIHLVLYKHQLIIDYLLNYCIGLKPLNLPSYVLMDIVDTLLFESKVTHYIKINKVIRINEQKY